MVWSIGLIQIRLVLPVYSWSRVLPKRPLKQLRLLDSSHWYLLVGYIPAVEDSFKLMRTDSGYI